LGFLKGNAFKNSPYVVDKLKGEVITAVEGICEDTLLTEEHQSMPVNGTGCRGITYVFMLE
jgi:hypothetical protein